MRKWITLICSALVLCSATARARDVAPAQPGHGELEAFTVRLAGPVAADDVIAAIIDAGGVQLAAACAPAPAAVVRILNPLAPGDYTDVACSALVAESGARTSAAPSSEPGRERVGEAPQRITPVGPFLCGLVGLIEGGAMAKVCSDWRGRDSQVCSVGGAYNAVAWLVACSILF